MRSALQLDGKLTDHFFLATNKVGQNLCHVFFVSDKETVICFLADTGARVSVVLPSPAEGREKQVASTLEAVNGSAIACYGQEFLILDYGLQQTFKWIFVIDDVQHPIHGTDFLDHFCLQGVHQSAIKCSKSLRLSILCRMKDMTGTS